MANPGVQQTARGYRNWRPWNLKLKVLVFIIKEEDAGSKIIALNMGMSIDTIAILWTNK